MFPLLRDLDGLQIADVGWEKQVLRQRQAMAISLSLRSTSDGEGSVAGKAKTFLQGYKHPSKKLQPSGSST
jgi:Flp pilus assembly protein CpaB